MALWRPRQLRRAPSDKPVVVFSEYTIVLGTVALAAGLALYALGEPLFQAYDLTRLFILSPLP
jgi:hypothetical protein